MEIQILAETGLQDGSTRFNIGVSDGERIYLGYILESFEGWCNYTTPIKEKPILQVDVAPDFLNDFKILFEFLKNWEIK